MTQYSFIGRLKDLPSLHVRAFHLQRVPDTIGARFTFQYNEVSAYLELIWM